MLALSLPDVSSSALTAVRWRRELLVGDEDVLGFPLTSPLRWNALAYKPLRHLTIVVADLPYRHLNIGRLGVSVVVGQVDHHAGATTRESARSVGSHV